MNISEFIEVQKKIIPETVELMELRYEILLYIKAHQPVGRRNLANELSLGERLVRNEIEFLNRINCVEVERQGIHLTSKGEEILIQLKEVMYSYKNFEGIVEQLREKLGVKKIFVVPGDAKKNKVVLDFMGQTVTEYMSNIMRKNSVIAVTGGSSVAAVAKNMPEMNLPNVVVLPARGGVGKSHSIQANSIVSTLADKLHSQREVLHLPDSIDREILDVLKETPEIKAVFNRYQDIDILIFGIGRADVMSEWRHLCDEKIKYLKEEKAVAETFGYFLDGKGKIICPSSSVGISLEQYLSISNVIAVAGGSDKAEAIEATCKVRKNLVLITDESAALEILRTHGRNKDDSKSSN